jgi:hypothetical protein
MSDDRIAAVAKEFSDGYRSPKAGRREAEGVRRTQKDSYWFCDLCPACLHSFREGDLVEIDDGGTVRHRDPLLGCPAGLATASAPTDGPIVMEFLQGALSLWPPDERSYLFALSADHPLVLRPAHSFKRPQCVVCGHTLRAGEIVLICPCAAHERRPVDRCQVAVHHDPLNGLYCYGDWHPQHYNLRCPATLRKIGG